MLFLISHSENANVFLNANLLVKNGKNSNKFKNFILFPS